jgi:hypothetical protein
VRVKVVKPQKFDNVQAVGVQIERRAGDAPALPRAARPCSRLHAVAAQIGAGSAQGWCRRWRPSTPLRAKANSPKG